MAKSITISVQITKDMADFIESGVEQGEYLDASDVVRDAMRTLMDDYVADNMDRFSEIISNPDINVLELMSQTLDKESLPAPASGKKRKQG